MFYNIDLCASSTSSCIVYTQQEKNKYYVPPQEVKFAYPQRRNLRRFYSKNFDDVAPFIFIIIIVVVYSQRSRSNRGWSTNYPCSPGAL